MWKYHGEFFEGSLLDLRKDYLEHYWVCWKGRHPYFFQYHSVLEEPSLIAEYLHVPCVFDTHGKMHVNQNLNKHLELKDICWHFRNQIFTSFSREPFSGNKNAHHLNVVQERRNVRIQEMWTVSYKQRWISENMIWNHSNYKLY